MMYTVTHVYYDPLSSWEAPWNHMKYFWHDDPQLLGEDPICCKTTPNQYSVSSIEKRPSCEVKEIQLPPQPSEEKNACSEDIEAIKPVPWRNVFPPSNVLCKQRRRSRSSDNPKTLEEIMTLCEPGNYASTVISTPAVRKPLVLKPRACKTPNPESPKILPPKNINNSAATRKGPPILPLGCCAYNFDKLGQDKMQKNNANTFGFNPVKNFASNCSLQDVKRTVDSTPPSDKCAPCATKNDDKTIKGTYSATNTFPLSRKSVEGKQKTPTSFRSNSFGKQEVKANNSSTRKDTQVCNDCRCGFDKIKCAERKKVEPKEESNKRILKIKKAPQPIRTSMENIDRWKQEAAEEARAKMFQSIRDAPTKKNPGLKCEDEVLSLSSNLCSFCNQPLSPFGYCNECLPPTPIAKSVQGEVTIKQSKSCCSQLNKNPSPAPLVLADANSLLNEINKFRTTFFNTGVSSSQPRRNNSSTDIQSLMKPQNFQDVSQSDAQLPVTTQMQTCYDQYPKDIVPPSQNQEMSASNQAHTNWLPLAPTQPITCPCYSQYQSTMPSYSTPPQDCAHYPFNFHHSNDCPLQNLVQYNTYPMQRNVHFSSPTQPFFHDPSRNVFTQAPYPNNCIPLSLGSANNARYNSTSASFAATLDIANASPQDINVIVYANRVLVAEAINRTANGECVSAQSWALPPGVDVETLRCYLDVDKLFIIAYPPPPSFNWKFSKTPAALGPPKFLNMPCPFDP